jgi:hypothetical protein
MSFTTNPGPPSAITDPATLVTATSAQLNARGITGGAATTGWFRYSTVDPVSCNDSFGTRVPTTGGTSLGSGSGFIAYSQSLTGLSPGTTYYFCAIAQNSVGISIGAKQSFTTLTPPNVSFGGPEYSVAEGTPTVTITVVRGGDTNVAFSVDYSSSGGNATAGTCGVDGDYVSVSGTLNFASGDLTKIFTVPICTDALSESPAETFDLTLSNPTNGATIPSGSGLTTVTILDAATEFSNSTLITATPGNVASSDVTVSGFAGNISGLRVTLFDFDATNADDVDILLVSPAGQKYLLVGDVGGSNPITVFTLTLEDDGSAGFLPDSNPITLGQNYFPTNCETPVSDFDGAPAGPIVEPGCGPTLTNTMASTFGATNPNGPWTLFIREDAGGAPFGVASASISGWGIQFLVPTAAPVSITGRVSTSTGRGIGNATITVAGGGLTEPRRAYTSSFGYYRVEGLTPGVSYIVTVNAKRYIFPQPTRVYQLVDSVADANFIAAPRE